MFSAAIGCTGLAGCAREIMPKDFAKRRKSEEQPDVKLHAENPKPIGPMRTWTAADGGSKVEGALIKVEDGRVWLEGEKGQIDAYPLERLSEADRRYAEETAK